MSKHRDRKERREAYHRMLDAELDQERPFVVRAVGTMNRDGMDFGADGRPIRSDFWRYIRSREAQARQAARAALFLVEKAVNSVRVHRG